MHRLSNSRPWLTALTLAWLCLPVSPAHTSELGAATPYRPKHLFYGCWTHTVTHPERPRWQTSYSTWCFEHGRLLSGSTFDAGDGWDYCERWHVRGQHIAVPGTRNDNRECVYAFSEDRRTLILRDCASAGDWQRDDMMTEAHRGDRTCRMQVRPEPDEEP